MEFETNIKIAENDKQIALKYYCTQILTRIDFKAENSFDMCQPPFFVMLLFGLFND